MSTAWATAGSTRGRGLGGQFAQPDGLLGRLVGRVMAVENARANRLVVERLGVGPGDRVLEIGCGPGTALAHAARSGPALVAGIDPSEVMVAQARRRLRRAGGAAQVDIRSGRAEELPHPDGAFTRILTVHALHHWDDLAAGVGEIARVLAPGGVAALADRRERPGAHRDPHARGASADDLGALRGVVLAAGLDEVRIEEHDLGREILAIVLARRTGSPVSPP